MKEMNTMQRTLQRRHAATNDTPRERTERIPTPTPASPTTDLVAWAREQRARS